MARLSRATQDRAPFSIAKRWLRVVPKAFAAANAWAEKAKRERRLPHSIWFFTVRQLTDYRVVGFWAIVPLADPPTAGKPNREPLNREPLNHAEFYMQTMTPRERVKNLLERKPADRQKMLAHRHRLQLTETN